MHKIYSLKAMKLAVLALMMGFVSGIQAQVFTVSPSTTVYGQVEMNGYLGLQIDFESPTSSAMDLSWSLVSNSLDTDWTVTLCDYQACYPYVPNSRQMDPIPAGEKGFLKLTVNPFQDPGNGQLVFKVWETGNQQATEVEVTFDVTVLAVGIDEADLSGTVTAYPNPALDFVRLEGVNGGLLDAGTVSLYDLTGAEVLRNNVNAGSLAEINISALPAGMYTLRYVTENGALNKKIFKTH